MSLVRVLGVAAAAAALIEVAAPSPLVGQTCLGTPTEAGEVVFGGHRISRGVATSYGGTFQANLGGMVAVGTGFSIDTFRDLPENGFTSSITASWLQSHRGFSVCPNLQVQYSEVTPRGEGPTSGSPLESVAVAPGIGFGRDFPVTPEVTFGVHARPSVLLLFGPHARARGNRGVRHPENAVEAGVVAGLSLRLERLIVGAEIVHNTLSDAEPGIVVQVGFSR